MTTYATVGVQRIQTYLARSRHLWGRRGASEELVRLTTLPGNSQQTGIPDDELAVKRVLDNNPGVQLNPEGLDIDGVVSLRSAPDALEQQVDQAADALARAIREQLPGVTVTTSRVTSDANYAELSLERDSWDYRKTWYPLATEFPAVRLCDECRMDPASVTCPEHDKKVLRLCNDCASRHGGNDRWRRNLDKHIRPAGAAKSYPSRFTAEGWLLRELRSCPGHEKLGFSEDFEALGQVGPMNGDGELRRRTHEGNHVALIFADGNGMGALFNRLLKDAAKNGGDGDSTKHVRCISKRIKQATADALLTATKAVMTATESICPVVPHINGGDDVLVSVTAPRAWAFLQEFLAALRTSFEALEMECGHGLSMSASMAISKAEYPFPNQVELAETLMRRAKSAVHGQGWNIAWLDITHDGLAPDTHRPWLLDELADRTDAITCLRGIMTAHGEAALTGALAGDPGSRGLRLAHLARRMDDVGDLLELLHVSDPREITDDEVALIRDLTSIGRWWR